MRGNSAEADLAQLMWKLPADPHYPPQERAASGVWGESVQPSLAPALPESKPSVGYPHGGRRAAWEAGVLALLSASSVTLGGPWYLVPDFGGPCTCTMRRAIALFSLGGLFSLLEQLY